MPDGYLESFVQSHSVERTDGHCLKSQSHVDRFDAGQTKNCGRFPEAAVWKAKPKDLRRKDAQS
ncbi:nonribosomal peptide synthase [Aspergillus luchuensis]|uniref:Nonribosomal peptide synthase n=1 Tax=Aspergillus kawachii TaxID=1069201 RepID=A0A146FZW8_ASPKA|nr:nonribosomal peptide synthase [Aspergillus luchuensis]